jgi:hypothetical protein
MKLRSLALASLLFAVPALAQPKPKAAAPAPKEESSAPVKLKGAPGDKDDNVKAKKGANAKDGLAAKKLVQPESKAGAKAKGPVCLLHVDNRTNWNIDIYVDGDYVGDVTPFGDSAGAYVGGETRFYARAEFSDGDVLTWGPKLIDCNGSYTWTLTK